ncbi:MAG: radical SAM protein [Bacteroidales bacterium]|jgi:MoaA/NifB/PqqE/SkfB family radical SAM enzyme|nr:radical SAM protein [Bacteroidales bacterium]
MKYFYLFKWFIQAKFFNKKTPLQSVIFISDACNLRCRHCNVVNDENPNIKTFNEIEEELSYSYKLGARFIDFEGGEPLFWQDGDKTINDLVTIAKQIGFFSTTVTTNAQQPFNALNADSIWVSLDGLGEHHDYIRGKGTFEKLMENINGCHHSSICINMVINTNNYTNVGETIQFVKKHPNLKSISLNFHTPYQGTEYLFLPWKERKETIDVIIKMKKQGYPIINSVSGLKAMKTNKFKKYCWITNFIVSDGTKLPECAGKSLKMCNECGLCMAGEMYSLMSLKPDTVFAGLKLRI